MDMLIRWLGLKTTKWEKNKNNKFMKNMDPNSDRSLRILRYMYVYESNWILCVKYRYLRIKNQPTVDFTVTAHHTEKKKKTPLTAVSRSW